MRKYSCTAVILVIAIGILVATETPAIRVALSDTQVDKVISITQANFWGNAVGHDGKLLSPVDDEERKRLLIPRPEAVRVVNDAHKYGLALWCGLDWKPTYLKYMHVERTKPWDEKQIAFVGMLFGVAQGAVSQWASGACSTEDKKEIQKSMDAELTRLTGDGKSR